MHFSISFCFVATKQNKCSEGHTNRYDTLYFVSIGLVWSSSQCLLIDDEPTESISQQQILSFLSQLFLRSNEIEKKNQFVPDRMDMLMTYGGRKAKK